MSALIFYARNSVRISVEMLLWHVKKKRRLGGLLLTSTWLVQNERIPTVRFVFYLRSVL